MFSFRNAAYFVLGDSLAENDEVAAFHMTTQTKANTKSRTGGRLVIFQNFINEHNLWGTTAVLALSVHATVENNNLEFLLFSFSLFFPIHPHFQFLAFLSFLLSFFVFIFFAGNQQQLEVKVLDFCYSTDKSINNPPRIPLPPS